MLQGILRVQLEEASVIDQREEHIPKLRQHSFLLPSPNPVRLGGTGHLARIAFRRIRFQFIHLPHFHLQLAQLLLHLVPDLRTLIPVEAHAPRLVLDPVSLDHGRQGRRHTRKDRMLLAFLKLDFFPVLLHILGRLGLHLSKNMRMPTNQLIAQSIADIRKIEFPLFLAQFGIKGDMQQHIPHLLLDILVILVHNRVRQFESFLDRQRPQGVESLLLVPRTLLAQQFQNPQQADDSLFGCLGRILVRQKVFQTHCIPILLLLSSSLSSASIPSRAADGLCSCGA